MLKTSNVAHSRIDHISDLRSDIFKKIPFRMFLLMANVPVSEIKTVCKAICLNCRFGLI